MQHHKKQPTKKKVKKQMSKQPLQPHQWTNADGEVLILKRINKDRTAYGGFQYPEGIGAIVRPERWQPDPGCGHGIHGWPWGFGIGEGSDFNLLDDLWMVVSAKPEDVIGELSGGLKCKAREVRIRFEGSFKDAWAIVSSAQGDIIRNLTAMPDTKGSAASGYGSNLAASGNDSKLAASGNDSNLAASGNDSNLAASGNDSKLAASGYGSKLAASGENSACAISGNCGRIKVGARGAFAMAYWDDQDGWKFATGKVGEKGIEANTWYEVIDGKVKKSQHQD